MVLHIAITGDKATGKTTQAIKLSKFLHKKNYKVAYINQPHHQQIVYILKNMKLQNHEKALLMAVDRSLTYRKNNFKKFDIVIWDNSIINDYTNYTDQKTNTEYIKTINRYSPKMDLHIIIQKPHENKQPITENETTTIIPYIHESIDEVFESIVQKCFETLPRCNWCGRFFTKSTKNKKYCSTKCRKYSREEQNRENNRNYYNRYKDTLTEKQKGTLGSKGANLHGTRDPDFKKEQEKIRKGMKAIGLKKSI